MAFLELLHIAAAIFTVGPLTAATMTAPTVIRGGQANLNLLRWINRTTRLYGIGALLVFVLGIGLVRDEYSFNEFWIAASMTLFVVALGLLFAVVERDQRQAIARVEAGASASVRA